MLTEDQHMDDAFRKASDEVRFPYQPAFWEEVESQLADDSLDYAFKAAAGKAAAAPVFEVPADLNIDDAFLDEAFKSAGEDLTTSYKPEFWEQFQSDLPVIQQDEAFVAASNSVTADYRPHYWNAADVALQEEGLHYEYKKAYWKEARFLLDRADRRIFFLKWTGAATVLLLLSLAGILSGTDSEYGVTGQAQFSQNDQSPALAMNMDAIDHARLLADVQKDNLSSPGLSPVEANESNASDLSHVNGNDEPVVTNRNLQANGQLSAGNENTSHLGAGNNSGNDGEQTINLMMSSGGGNDMERNSGSVVNQNEVPGLDYNASPNLAETDLLSGTSAGESIHWLSFNNAVNHLNSDSQSNFAGNTVDDATKKLYPAGNTVTVPAYDGTELEIETKKFLTSTHNVSFFALGGIGNKYGTSPFTASWRTSFGFEYMNTSFGRLRNFEFGGSLSMSHVRQNDFGTERRVAVFSIDGGVDKLWYKLQLKDMMYANATAIMAYRITGTQKVRVSVSMDRLMFVQSNMSYQDKPDKGITTVNNNWGVKNGLNVYDVRLGLGYELQLGNRFAIQLNGSYGFLDRTDNDFMMNDITDHELNVTAGFKYTLFRKL